MIRFARINTQYRFVSRRTPWLADVLAGLAFVLALGAPDFSQAQDAKPSTELLEPEELKDSDFSEDRHAIPLEEKTGLAKAARVNVVDDRGRSFSTRRDFLLGFSPIVVLYLSPERVVVQTNVGKANGKDVSSDWKDFRKFVSLESANGANFFGESGALKLKPWEERLKISKEDVYLFDGKEFSKLSLVDVANFILSDLGVGDPPESYPVDTMAPFSPACPLSASAETTSEDAASTSESIEGRSVSDICENSFGNEPFEAELVGKEIVLTRLEGRTGDAFIEVHPAKAKKAKESKAKTAKFKVSIGGASTAPVSVTPSCNCNSGKLSWSCFMYCKKNYRCDYNLVSFSAQNSQMVQGALSKKSCLADIYKVCGGTPGAATIKAGDFGRSEVDDCFIGALTRWGFLQAERKMYQCYMRQKPRRLMNGEEGEQTVNSIGRKGMHVYSEVFGRSLVFSRASKKVPPVDPRKMLKAWYTTTRSSGGMQFEIQTAFKPILSPRGHLFTRYFSPEDNKECMQEAAGFDTSLPPHGNFFRTPPLRRVVFNEQCGVIAYDDKIDNRRVCSNTTYRGRIVPNESPIVLLWNRDADLNRAVSLTTFPLDPRKKGKVYQWKAGADAPLLVYDPEGTGKIVSATQLFGNWTFGHTDPARVRRTSLTSPQEMSKPLWQNGYEALALLDEDKNGEVSGAEREGLALWFDRNQDGISDIGEVQDLIAAGVERLSVTFDGRDAEGDLYSTAGFSRRLPNGELLTLRTVDWFSPAFDSKQDALAALSPAAQDSSAAVSPVHDNEPERATVVTASKFNGTWRYSLDDPGTEGFSKASQLGYNTGVMRLSVDGDGEVTGFTVSESPVTSTSDAASSIAFIQPLKGRLIDPKTIEFKLERVAGGGDLTSRVTLLDSGELRGSTQADASQANGDRKSVSYSWRGASM
jgi:hypothetical protein